MNVFAHAIEQFGSPIPILSKLFFEFDIIGELIFAVVLVPVFGNIVPMEWLSNAIVSIYFDWLAGFGIAEGRAI